MTSFIFTKRWFFASIKNLYSFVSTTKIKLHLCCRKLSFFLLFKYLVKIAIVNRIELRNLLNSLEIAFFFAASPCEIACDNLFFYLESLPHRSGLTRLMVSPIHFCHSHAISMLASLCATIKNVAAVSSRLYFLAKFLVDLKCIKNKI